MTGEEKAKELIEKFTPMTREWTGEAWIDSEESARSAAIIAVGEILDFIKGEWKHENSYSTFWKEVLNKL